MKTVKTQAAFSLKINFLFCFPENTLSLVFFALKNVVVWFVLFHQFVRILKMVCSTYPHVFPCMVCPMFGYMSISGSPTLGPANHGKASPVSRKFQGGCRVVGLNLKEFPPPLRDWFLGKSLIPKATPQSSLTGSFPNPSLCPFSV